jgi:Bacterial Ig domain
MKRRAAAAAAAFGLGSAALVLGPPPAGAVDITYDCTAQIGAGVAVTQAVTVNVTAPAEVNTGANIDVTVDVPESVVPATAGGVALESIQNIQFTLPIPTGTALATATALDAGVNAPGATVTPSASAVVVTVPPPPIAAGVSWRPPRVGLTLTATGAAGSTIQFLAGPFNVEVNVTGIGTVPVTCPAPTTPVVLASTTITALPPPGAPSANPDSAVTPAGVAVTVNVLGNDVAAVGVPIDPASVTVVTPPSNGTAVVNAGGTITYTPTAGFSGTDSLVYQVCSQIAPPAPCDTAIVTITVEPPLTTTTTSTSTTTAVPLPTTLPPTGGGGGSMGWLAVALVAIGGSLIGAARRRAH